MYRLAILICLLLENLVFGQNLLSFSDNNKYGFINSSGEIVISPKYDAVHQFSEGVAFIYIDGKIGLINENDELLIKPKFDHAKPFKDNVAIIGIDSLFGLIDKTGNYIIEPTFERIYFQNEGKIGVQLNDLWGFYSTDTGIPITDINYSSIGPFSEGLAMIQNQFTKKYGFINTSGEIEIPCSLGQVYGAFNNGYAAVCDSNRQNCYIDKNGKKVFDDNYYSVTKFHEGYAFVKKTDYNSGYFIDTLGRRKSPHNFKNAWFFSAGFCGVQTDSSYAVINTEHEIVFESKEIELRFFNDSGFGFFCDHSGKLTWGIMDTSMNVVSDRAFVQLFAVSSNQFLEFYQGDPNVWYGYSKRGYIDKKGEILWIEK